MLDDEIRRKHEEKATAKKSLFRPPFGRTLCRKGQLYLSYLLTGMVSKVPEDHHPSGTRVDVLFRSPYFSFQRNKQAKVKVV